MLPLGVVEIEFLQERAAIDWTSEFLYSKKMSIGEQLLDAKGNEQQQQQGPPAESSARGEKGGLLDVNSSKKSHNWNWSPNSPHRSLLLQQNGTVYWESFIHKLG